MGSVLLCGRPEKLTTGHISNISFGCHDWGLPLSEKLVFLWASQTSKHAAFSWFSLAWNPKHWKSEIFGLERRVSSTCKMFASFISQKKLYLYSWVPDFFCHFQWLSAYCCNTIFSYFSGNYGTEELSEAATCTYSGGREGQRRQEKSGTHKTCYREDKTISNFL